MFYIKSKHSINGLLTRTLSKIQLKLLKAIQDKDIKTILTIDWSVIYPSLSTFKTLGFVSYDGEIYCPEMLKNRLREAIIMEQYLIWKEIDKIHKKHKIFIRRPNDDIFKRLSDEQFNRFLKNAKWLFDESGAPTSYGFSVTSVYQSTEILESILK